MSQIAAAHSDLLRDRRDFDKIQAWYTAMLQRMRNPPSLDKLLKRDGDDQQDVGQSLLQAFAPLMEKRAKGKEA